MTEAVFDFHAGHAPLLISIPHDGRQLPPDMRAGMTPAGLALPDTDWHVAKLYGFAASIGASVITARYSRYVVDLNRPASDEQLYPGQLSTGLCPQRTFSGDAIYRDGEAVSDVIRAARVTTYWRPYHEQIAATLQELQKTHGYALLWDAHSIISKVPALFDGELPELNLGTNKGQSCAAPIEAALQSVAGMSPYSTVCNGRFTGGYITRNYGQPAHNVHAVQLEIAQRSYMDENDLRYDDVRGRQLGETLKALLRAYMESAHALHR